MTNEVTTSPPPSLAVDAWNELDDPVTIIDEAFRPMLCNAAFHEWTHGSGTATELRDGAGGYLLALGRVFADEAVSRVSRAVKSVLAGEVVDDTLVIETTASGPSTTEIIRVRIRQSRAFPGHVLMVHTTVTDYELGRREREAFARLADVIPDAIIVTDRTLRVTRWNRGAERSFGVPESQALGKVLTTLVTGLSRDVVLETLRTRFVFHDPPLTTDDDVPQISAWAIPTDDGHPHFVAAVFLVRDHTPERRARFAAAQANERVRHAQRLEAVGALAGGVAHDFNNLLSVIQSYANFVTDELPRDSPLAADMQEILGASQRGAALTRQLLAFGRRQVFEPKTTTLDEIITEVDRLLARLLGEHISVVVERSDDEKTIRVDVAQLEQVVINLALNARDAMPTGGVLTLRTRRVELTEAQAARDGAIAGAYAELAVIDTGSGIDDSVLAHIFEPFFTTKGSQHGTGLGLATAYGIVKQSGGHLVVESTTGVGTTFRVRMPLAPSAAAAPRRQRPTPMVSRTRPAFIVVVEDEPKVREIVRRTLSARGYGVHHFATANEALPFITTYQGTIDLLLTDLVMPGMSGAELSERVARARPETRILFMTGYADDSAERLGITLRGRDVLHKPFAPATLVARVRTALENDATGSGPGNGNEAALGADTNVPQAAAMRPEAKP
jgi:signal transduction histidine kinase/CheY-like chemotaxis protein